MKTVAVVILNYKVKDDLLDCLKSVQKSSYTNIKIIVVDNDSQDGVAEAVGAIKGVEFIQNSANLGYTGGNNVGIRRALKEGVDFILVLNPDTTVAKDAIEKLVEVAEQTAAGMLGPKIYFKDSNKIWYAGGILDLANVLGSHRGMDQEDDGSYDRLEETDYISGAAMLVRCGVFDKVGLLDERYFLYYEDSDLSYRARLAGFKLMYVPEAMVYHGNAHSTGLGSPLQDYYITRNRMLFAAKFLSLRTRWALFREGLRNFGQPVRRKALIDFWLGRFGKGQF